MDEFEVKSFADARAVSDLERVARFGEPERMTDVYWDTPDRSLFRNAAFVRVRDGNVLQVKHNLGISSLAHLHSKEDSWAYPLSVDSQRDVDDLLLAISGTEQPVSFDELVEFLVIDKTRRVGAVDRVIVAHDRIAGLGDFLELEVASDRDLRLLRELSARYALAHIPIGYVEMFLRKHDWPLYLAGRFVLPEDVSRM